MRSPADLRPPPRALGWWGALPLGVALAAFIAAAAGASVAVLYAALMVELLALAFSSFSTGGFRFEVVAAPILTVEAIANATASPDWSLKVVVALGVLCAAGGAAMVRARTARISGLGGELFGLGLFVVFSVAMLATSAERLATGGVIGWGSALALGTLAGWLAYWTPESHRRLRPSARVFAQAPAQLGWHYLARGYADWEKVDPDMLDMELVDAAAPAVVWKQRVLVRSDRADSVDELTAFVEVTLDEQKRTLRSVMLGVPHYCHDLYRIDDAPGGCLLEGSGLLTLPYWHAALGLMLLAGSTVRSFSAKRAVRMNVRRARLEAWFQQLQSGASGAPDPVS